MWTDGSDTTSDLVGIPCTLMRGGTSKGAYFLADDLPSDPVKRDEMLLAIMGSPDVRQIDGIGGANPLTSKVAIISKSDKPNADIDYLFLQVFVDKAIVSDAQNCGNILAGVAPFALEKGLVAITGKSTTVRIFMQNTQKIATAIIHTPNGKVQYRGKTLIDGVPNPASDIGVYFDDLMGADCGSLLPTGRAFDVIDGIGVTCVDNGMPVVVLRAADFGLTGYESCDELDGNISLKSQLEQIRVQAGRLMGLGDVTNKSVPKMTLISPPINGGLVHTRTFIPHQCHQAIGVFGAVSVATVCKMIGSVADGIVNTTVDVRLGIEHPSGQTFVLIEQDKQGNVVHSGIVLTARKLFVGQVFIAI